MPGEPELRTSRLLLRRWRDDDHEPFAAPLRREESDAFVDRIEHGFEERRWGLWAVEAPGVAAFALDEIVSFTTHRNTRSRWVMERLGMHRDPADDFDNPDVAIGAPIRPHVLYRVERTSWRG